MLRRTFNKIIAGFIAAFTMPYTASGKARRRDVMSSLKDYSQSNNIDMMFDKNFKTMAINCDIYEGITPREYVAICQHFKKTYKGKVYIHDTTKVPPRVIYDGLKEAPADSYIITTNKNSFNSHRDFMGRTVDEDPGQYYPVFKIK